MSKSNIADYMLEAVDIIAQHVVQDLKYDKTITAVIVDDSSADQGFYTVQEGQAKYTAWAADGATYKNKDTVLVTIPNADYNNQKIIMTKIHSNKLNSELVTTIGREQGFISFEKTPLFSSKQVWEVTIPHTSTGKERRYFQSSDVEQVFSKEETSYNKIYREQMEDWEYGEVTENSSENDKITSFIVKESFGDGAEPSYYICNFDDREITFSKDEQKQIWGNDLIFLSNNAGWTAEDKANELNKTTDFINKKIKEKEDNDIFYDGLGNNTHLSLSFDIDTYNLSPDMEFSIKAILRGIKKEKNSLNQILEKCPIVCKETIDEVEWSMDLLSNTNFNLSTLIEKIDFSIIAVQEKEVSIYIDSLDSLIIANFHDKFRLSNASENTYYQIDGKTLLEHCYIVGYASSGSGRYWIICQKQENNIATYCISESYHKNSIFIKQLYQMELDFYHNEVFGSVLNTNGYVSQYNLYELSERIDTVTDYEISINIKDNSFNNDNSYIKIKNLTVDIGNAQLFNHSFIEDSGKCIINSTKKDYYKTSDTFQVSLKWFRLNEYNQLQDYTKEDINTNDIAVHWYRYRPEQEEWNNSFSIDQTGWRQEQTINQSSITFTPYMNKDEKIMAVIEYKNQKYYSNILEFENYWSQYDTNMEKSYKYDFDYSDTNYNYLFSGGVYTYNFESQTRSRLDSFISFKLVAPQGGNEYVWSIPKENTQLILGNRNLLYYDIVNKTYSSSVKQIYEEGLTPQQEFRIKPFFRKKCSNNIIICAFLVNEDNVDQNIEIENAISFQTKKENSSKYFMDYCFFSSNGEEELFFVPNSDTIEITDNLYGIIYDENNNIIYKNFSATGYQYIKDIENNILKSESGEIFSTTIQMTEKGRVGPYLSWSPENTLVLNTIEAYKLTFSFNEEGKSYSFVYYPTVGLQEVNGANQRQYYINIPQMVYYNTMGELISDQQVIMKGALGKDTLNSIQAQTIKNALTNDQIDFYNILSTTELDCPKIDIPSQGYQATLFNLENYANILPLFIQIYNPTNGYVLARYPYVQKKIYL